ncbi:hypothetical protein ACLKMH_20480 [Psychromonas sp. KJ10-10]|uniref:hypothetical protein n=1 Tax=Psychromonas sp. KJ10-10 TaxID=3391823 RepID=UPI0039B60498
MDFSKQLSQQQILIYQYDNKGISLTVKENEQFRWFEYGGSEVQSLMNKERPEQIILPVYQSLLLFLLLDNNFFANQPRQLLNLGLGGASIERALATISDLHISSVESSLNIVEMAKKYFKVPAQVKIVAQTAEHFIEQTDVLYDVVLCDLFIDGKSADCIFNGSFYSHLCQITATNATLMINLQANNNEQLIQLLLIIKRYFPYIALNEFDDYKNIVMLASKQTLPPHQALIERFEGLKQSGLLCFQHLNLQKIINRLKYIP